MRILFLVVLLQLGISGLGQNRCVSSEYLSALLIEDAEGASRIKKAESFLKNKTVQKNIADDEVIRIPVVVHLLYNQSQQNLSDTEIQSGLAALNRDFRRRNEDAVNTPVRFQHLAADVQIEFYLAKADPWGRATSGIERRFTTRNGWIADDKIKLSAQGGLDAWDSKSYLNIWIGNLIGASGYASVPGSAAAIDGIVVNSSVFGTLHAPEPFNLGRTAVHEVGHWLGLKHIWGETQCGDDGVADTPQQAFFTKGCPADFRSTCSNGEMGDMYMNYMDYTNDACTNLFTMGQRHRMRATFAEGGPRASLLQSKGLQEPRLQESSLLPQASLFPNPAADKITLQVPESLLGKKIFIYNGNGQVLQVETVQAVQQTLQINRLRPGVYLLKGESFQQKFIKL